MKKQMLAALEAVDPLQLSDCIDDHKYSGPTLDHCTAKSGGLRSRRRAITPAVYRVYSASAGAAPAVASFSS
jgi:hypothetical protein